MRLVGNTCCPCGLAIVTRSIAPETITMFGRDRGLVVTETCRDGHVMEFTVQRLTLTELGMEPSAGSDT